MMYYWKGGSYCLMTAAVILMSIRCSLGVYLSSRSQEIINNFSARLRKRDESCVPEFQKEIENCACVYRGLCKSNGDCMCCFDAFYENPEEKCKTKNFCNTSPCQNGGTCEQVWGNYFCKCPASYNGRKCEKGTGSKTVTRVSTPLVTFSIVNFSGRDFVVLLIIDGEVGTEFSFLFTLGNVIINGDRTMLEDDISLVFYRKMWQHQKMQFPDVAKKLFFLPYVYSVNKEMKGYSVPLSVQINNAGEEQFSGAYKLYIDTESNCVAFAQVDGCADGNKEIINTQRGKAFSAYSSSKSSCMAKSSSVIWYLCNLTKTVPFPYTPLDDSLLRLPESKKVKLYRM